MHAGRDTNARGTRRNRTKAQTRLHTGPDTLKRETAFADKPYPY